MRHISEVLAKALAKPSRSPGIRNLAKHMSGAKLTYKAAVLAKCADCMGTYLDGYNDCRIPACPLYPFQPYRKKAILGPGSPQNVEKTELNS